MIDKFIWSKYNYNIMIREREKLAVAEHEIHQEQGRDIFQDDILNLRISLETSDADSFITSLK